MQTEREQKLIRQISEAYGRVIDLEKAPGVMIEILRDYGPNISKLLDVDATGTGGAPGVSSIAIAGPGSGTVTTEDLMRVMLQLRRETAELREELAKNTARLAHGH